MDRSAVLTAFLREIWSDGRVDRVPDFIAPQYRIHHDPGDPWDGQTLDRAGFAERLVTSRAAAPDQVFTPVRMVAQDSAVAVAWTWRGTHQGDVAGIAATGRPIEMSGLTIYDFDGAQLTGHWQVADRLSVYRAIALA